LRTLGATRIDAIHDRGTLVATVHRDPHARTRGKIHKGQARSVVLTRESLLGRLLT
jgi:hypothetical protein